MPVLVLFGLYVLTFNIVNAENVRGDQVNSFHFQSLSRDDGLSNGKINDIIQDRHGYIWVATENGLNQYDGYEFRIFRHHAQNAHSLPDNAVKVLYEDSRGRLWVGHESKGLTLWDRDKGRFINFPFPGADTGIWQIVKSITEDQAGNIWVGSAEGRVYRLSLSDSSYTTIPVGGNERHRIDESLAGTYGEFHVEAMVTDPDGFIWISIFNQGVYKWDPIHNKSIKRFFPDEIETATPFHLVTSFDFQNDSILWAGSNNEFFKLNIENDVSTYLPYTSIKGMPDGGIMTKSILAEENGTIWMGTRANGLGKYNSTTGEIRFFRSHPFYPNSINMNFISTLLIDRSGLLWAGTNGRGINTYSTYKPFHTYPGIPSIKHNYLNKSIRAIFEDSKGDIWIGSYTGVDRISRNYDVLTSFPFRDDNDKYIYSQNAYVFFEDSRNRLWLGTEGSGIYRIDRENNRIYKPANFPNIFVFDIEEDAQGILWLATNTGLVRFDPERLETVAFLNHFRDKRLQNIHNIEKSPDNVLWLATHAGIIKFNPKDQSYQIFNNAMSDHFNMANRINSIYQSSTDTLWLATHEQGIGIMTLLNGVPDTIRYFTMADGLAADIVYGILQDDDGFMWISTIDGISRFNPENESFRNFGSADGLQSDEFNNGAFHKSRDGKLYFGGMKGVNSFYPRQIRKNPHPPDVVLSKIVVNGIERTNDYQDKNDKLQFSHTDNTITFKFSALDFHAPTQNQYAYKLKGVHDEWIKLGTNREMTFTSLNPGNFTILVRGSNSDGVWNEEGKAIQFRITAPFWKTAEFYQLLAFLLIGSLLATLIFIYRRNQHLWNIIRFLNLSSKFSRIQRKPLKTPENLVPVQQSKNSESQNGKSENMFRQIEYLMKEKQWYKNENISVKDLAYEIGTNELYISRAIKACSGMNFNTYINNYRIQAAKRLLLENSDKVLSVSEIGYKTGFSNPSTFSRIFSKYTGMTPTAFRELEEEGVGV